MSNDRDQARADAIVIPPARDVEGSGGVIWHLPADLDLNANIVRLAPGGAIASHRNAEVDVLVVVRENSGHLIVDGTRHELTEESIVLVPRGATREITAGPAGVTYLTVHRQRGSLSLR